MLEGHWGRRAAPEQTPACVFWLAWAVGPGEPSTQQIRQRHSCCYSWEFTGSEKCPENMLKPSYVVLEKHKCLLQCFASLSQKSVFSSVYLVIRCLLPSPPKEKKNICSRLLEIKGTQTCKYGFLSFSYTESQGHGNTRLRGLE